MTFCGNDDNYSNDASSSWRAVRQRRGRRRRERISRCRPCQCPADMCLPTQRHEFWDKAIAKSTALARVPEEAPDDEEDYPSTERIELRTRC